MLTVLIRIFTFISALSAPVRIDERVVGPLERALSHQDDDVREWTAKALGLIGDPRTLEPALEKSARQC